MMRIYAIASIEKSTGYLNEIFFSKDWPKSQHPSQTIITALVREYDFPTDTNFHEGAERARELFEADPHLNCWAARVRP